MRPGRDEGVVLLLVLVVIALTISSVFAFARTSVLEVMSVRQRAERVRAPALARYLPESNARAQCALLDAVVARRRGTGR